MRNLEDIIGTIINGDCIDVMADMPINSIDLIVTSCPYGVGINYDVHNDDVDDFANHNKIDDDFDCFVRSDRAQFEEALQVT